VVQKILQNLSASSRSFTSEIIHFAKRVLNPNVTDFNFEQFPHKEAESLYEHLITNCPKLKRIVRPEKWVALNKKRLYSAPQALFCLKMCWEDLRVASFEGYCFSDEILRHVSVSAPKIE
jgi:hypothetical protein